MKEIFSDEDNYFFDQVILEYIWKGNTLTWILHKRQEVNQKLYKPLCIRDWYIIKFHFLLRGKKSNNIEHMLIQFYKKDLHQNVDIKGKMQRS